VKLLLGHKETKGDSIHKKKITGLFKGIGLLLILSLTYKCYTDINIFLNEKQQNAITCKGYFSKNISHKWLKLTGCSIDYENVLLKNISKEIFIPIEPEGNDGKPLPKKLWVKVDDKKLFDEFMKTGSQKEEDPFKMVTQDKVPG